MERAHQPLCHCGSPAAVRVSQKKGSSGCEFWGCPQRPPCTRQTPGQGCFLGFLAGKGPVSRAAAAPVAAAGAAVPAAAPAAAPAAGAPVATRGRSRSRSQEHQQEPAPAAAAAEAPPGVQGPSLADALQARLGPPAAEQANSVVVDRSSCRPFLVYGPAGQKRNSKVFLDGGLVDPRAVDVEVFLHCRPSPPRSMSAAAVLYMLCVPASQMEGRMQKRNEFQQGRPCLLKAGFVRADAWFWRGWQSETNEEQWLKRVVAQSYLNRLRTVGFWQKALANAVRSVEGLTPLVVGAKLVDCDEAARLEAQLGQAILACPGVVALQDRIRWAEGQGHFWHFAGPCLGAVGPLA
jgi:hypothetical protein